MLKSILIKYWGYSSFRPLQEEIINAVLEGKDTLALLPTGGGKSICFQVPAMVKEGVCLVITPLIALMKDQVEHLKKKGIKASAIHSGLHNNEIEIIVDNCFYGGTKFLYVSPERLETNSFREVLRNMNINLIAVDEAHCISQWGYDFRPPYLNIADARQFLPGIPVLALTATATPDVVDDIQQKLKFKKKNLIKASFERKNLAYRVIRSENKEGYILKLLHQFSGTGIIYVRSRKKTREVFEFLVNNNISADYYHAGLSPKARNDIQDAWMKGTKRVIVATNAFGMGIDKSNVRCVIHLDIPDCLESYFQEAGRAGRDDEESAAVLIYDEADILRLKQNLDNAFPPLDVIKSVYNALGNFFQLAVGSGKDISFDFNLVDFSANYNFQPVVAFNALKILEKEGYIIMTEVLYNPSKIFIKLDKEDLYRFQIENPGFDKFIKLLLRSYSGLFSNFVIIHEKALAQRAGVEQPDMVKILKALEKNGIIDYLPQTDKPQIIFTQERFDRKDISISRENYKDRKVSATKRMQSVLRYITTDHICRNQLLLNYFGERNSRRCGKCDVCLSRNKMEISDLEFDQAIIKIKKILSRNPLTIYELIKELNEFEAERLIRIVQWLKDNNKITEEQEKLGWRQQISLDL